MKSLGIVISNFNRKDYLLKCVESVLASSFQDFDVIVGDNASSDGSVEALQERYGNNDRLTIVTNEYNKGAAGGFNAGLKVVLNKKYDYFMLMDSDIIVDPDAIGASYEYLRNNEDVAIVGSKLYIMDRPEQIQAMGANINFEQFYTIGFYRNRIDDGTLPEVVDCDYVPSCAAMGRGALLEKVGLIDEDYFIYWEDVEWIYRYKSLGYKVVCYSKSKVWHKMHAAVQKNTFATYLQWRNEIRFFVKHCEESQLESFCNHYLNKLAQGLYSCNYQGKKNVAKSLLHAYQDGIYYLKGAPLPGRINDVDILEDRLKKSIEVATKILIYTYDDRATLMKLLNKIKDSNSNTAVTIVKNGELSKLIEGLEIKFLEGNELLEEDIKAYDTCFAICNHIFNVENMRDDMIYVDEYLNTIFSQEDRKYCMMFSHFKDVYISLNYPIMIEQVTSLKKQLL